MNKFFLPMIVLFINSINYSSYASSYDVFKYDESIIESKFAQLSKVEDDLSQQKDFDVLSVDSLLNKSGINDFSKSSENKNEANNGNSNSGSGILLFINRVFGSSLTYYNTDASRQILVYGGGCCLLSGTGLIIELFYDFII